MNAALQNPGFLVCDYYDYKTKKSFVGVAASMMWGVKSCRLEVTQESPKIATLSYKWPPGLTAVETKFDNELKKTPDEKKHKVFAKIQAFAKAMDKRLTSQRESPTSVQKIDLPQAVVPQTFHFNVGDVNIDDDIIVAEFEVASTNLCVNISRIQS
ncbi:unnamed protein product [Aphanomyces euteiches]